MEDVAGLVQQAGVHSLRFCETLLSDPEQPGSKGLEVRDGYASGAFVVLGVQKT